MCGRGPCTAAAKADTSMPPCSSYAILAADYTRSSLSIINLAALTLDALSPFHYPGAPLSIDYLENLCHLSSPHCWRGASQRRHSKEVDFERKKGRSCTDSKDEARREVQGYMSQRTAAPGPPSNAPRRDSQSLPSLPPSLSRPQSSHYAPPESPYTTLPPTGSSRTTLPPLGLVPSASRLPPLLTGAPSSRPLGFQSILNPSQHDMQSPSQMGRTTTYGRLPSPAASTAPPAFPQIAKRPGRSSPTAEEMHVSGSRAERRILTPKSPGMRVSSAGGRRSFAVGPFGPSRSPLMRGESRMYTAEPGPSRSAEIPPLPLPTPVGRSSNPYSSLAECAPGQPRRPSSARNPFAASAIQTQGESPSTSHSSYSRFSQSSPILRYGPSTQNPSNLQSGSTRQPVSLPPGQSSDNLGEGPYDMSKGSYGISIPTEGGQMLLPVELDVEQASKTANEKRKRNAGASARFRQRRKEKEREASQTISSLERNLRALEDERNHYRSERDFFRDLSARQLGPGQMPQRPLTPRAQTVSRPSLGDTPPQWQDISRETSEPLPPNLRRRTSSFPTTFPAPVAAPPMLPPQAQSYGFGLQPPAPVLQNTFPPTRPLGAPSFQPQPPPSPHSHSTFPPTRPPAQTYPPQPPPSPHSTSSQDPFRRDLYRRSWNPGA